MFENFRKWIQDKNSTDRDSYVNLKRALGILAMALPVVCLVWSLAFSPCHAVEHSISHYYHTSLRDVFVGLLAAVAIFLMTYTGYGWVDNLASWVIGVVGAGIVVFPCPTVRFAPPPIVLDPCFAALPREAAIGILRLPQETSGTVHIILAGLFFVFLAAYSIIVFPMTDKDNPGPKKLFKNWVYRICGLVMLATMALLLIVYFAAPDFLGSTVLGFICETIMLFAFGVSWLVKGDLPFLRDPETVPAGRKAAAGRSPRSRKKQ